MPLLGSSVRCEEFLEISQNSDQLNYISSPAERCAVFHYQFVLDCR